VTKLYVKRNRIIYKDLSVFSPCGETTVALSILTEAATATYGDKKSTHPFVSGGN
jgi:hypothetical protein